MTATLQEPSRDVHELQSDLAAVDRSLCRVEFCPNGVVLDANDNFLRLFGYERDGLVGRQQSVLVRRSERDSAEYLEFWRGLRDGRPRQGIFERVARDSSPRWVQSTYTPVHDAGGDVRKIVAYAVDVTAYKVADDITEDAGRLFRAQLAAIDRAHCRVEFDASGYVVDANENFLALMGYPAEELIWSHHNRLVFDSDTEGDEYERFWKALRSGEHQQGEYRRRARDGSERWIHGSYTPVCDRAGRVEKIVKYATDITEAKRRVRQRSDQQRLESIGTLAAGLAHEINSPMQSIVGNIQFLGAARASVDRVLGLLALLGEGGDLPGDYLDRLRTAYRETRCDHVFGQQRAAVEESDVAARRVIDIVRAMKDYSHVNQEAFAPFDLNEVVGQAVTITRNRWSQEGELTTDLDASAPEPTGIASDLCQVAVNLIVNAADALQDRVDASQPGRIAVATRRRGADRLVLEVRDNGCGMTPETRERLFDRFFTTKEVGRGTGQGLAIVHDIVVTRHSGSIEIESEPGVGATMRVVLPLKPRPASDGAATSTGYSTP